MYKNALFFEAKESFFRRSARRLHTEKTTDDKQPHVKKILGFLRGFFVCSLVCVVDSVLAVLAELELRRNDSREILRLYLFLLL